MAEWELVSKNFVLNRHTHEGIQPVFNSEYMLVLREPRDFTIENGQLRPTAQHRNELTEWGIAIWEERREDGYSFLDKDGHKLIIDFETGEVKING